MNQVDIFIDEQEGNQREIMNYLHLWLTQNFNLKPKMRYKIPFYDGHSWICYLNPIAKNKVELAFIQGKQLSNSQGLLQFKNRKQIAGISFEKLEDIPHEGLEEIVQEALMIDEMKKK